MQKQKAFTLVELAIVLVIIGLIVGGVLVGQDLIRGATLRAVTSEINADIAAVHTFRLKYRALPGDMANTKEFFPLDTSCGGAATNGTCPGDGNDQIGAGAESLRARQQLGMAGLVAGSYTGTTVTAGAKSIGVNMPPSKWGNATRDIEWDTGWDGIDRIGHRVVFGGTYAAFTGSTPPWEGVMTAQDAADIDDKIDDGIADHGKLIGNSGQSYYLLTNKCTTAHSAPFSYVKLDTDKDCHIYYFF